MKRPPAHAVLAEASHPCCQSASVNAFAREVIDFRHLSRREVFGALARLRLSSRASAGLYSEYVRVRSITRLRKRQITQRLRNSAHNMIALIAAYGATDSFTSSPAPVTQRSREPAASWRLNRASVFKVVGRRIILPHEMVIRLPRPKISGPSSFIVRCDK